MAYSREQLRPLLTGWVFHLFIFFGPTGYRLKKKKLVTDPLKLVFYRDIVSIRFNLMQKKIDFAHQSDESLCIINQSGIN